MLILLGIYAISFVHFTFCRPLTKHISGTPSCLQHSILHFNQKYYTDIFQPSIKLFFLLLTDHRTYTMGKQILFIHPSSSFSLVHFIGILMNCMNNLSISVWSHTDAFSYRHNFQKHISNFYWQWNTSLIFQSCWAAMVPQPPSYWCLKSSILRPYKQWYQGRPFELFWSAAGCAG